VVQEVRAVDGVRVTKVGGVTCYSQLGDTEVHDELRGCVRELVVSSSTVFSEREEKDPGWFQVKELELSGLVAVRNAAFERGRLGNSAGPKRALKQARGALKQAVREAKNPWIVSTVTDANSVELEVVG
jgi:hypothetical protein